MAYRVSVGIVGAGPAGLALACILRRSKVPVRVFERAPQNSDQGTGFDLHQNAQRVLARAGVTPGQFSDMSRAGSDLFCIFKATDTREPLMRVGVPRLAQRLLRLKPQPETNRQALQQTLLGNLGPGVVSFDCAVSGARSAGEGRIELLGQGDSVVLGAFDVLVDASGVGSRLRRMRVDDGDTGAAHYTGLSLVHGVIPAPEESLDPAVVRMLGQGTAMVLGPRGRILTLQRFGPAQEDLRTSLYYSLPQPTAMTLSEALQVPRGGAMRTDAAAVERVREWLREDMRRTPLPPVYYSIADAVTSVAIRPIFQHPVKPVFRTDTAELPLVCIGDALHSVPPYTGEGCQLALADADDLANVLLTEKPFHAAMLRALETAMMERVEPVLKRAEFSRSLMARLNDRDSVEDLSLLDLCNGNRPVAAALRLYNRLV